MMRLATGHPRATSKPAPCTAFTLVELVVVMTLMVIAIGVAAPSFKGFLQGRNQEDEARRFLSLTRYGLSRAVAEGMPVDLWINVKQKQIRHGRLRRLYRNQDQLCRILQWTKTWK